MRKQLATAVILSAGLLVTTATVWSARTPVVPFSHKKHIVDVEAACLDCHKEASSATTAATMLVPKLADCYTCHDEAEMKWDAPADSIPWHLPTRELIFDHSRHIAQGLDCQTCHAGVEKAEKAPSGGMPAMSLCIDCHSERAMSDDCGNCHSQVHLLRPKDHVADWILDHPEIARSDDRTCATCHQQSYCSECHEGAALGLAIINQEDAPVDRIGPLATAHQGNDILILQRAHDLNYRYTHGSDVRAKTMDCAVCHDIESFCMACHKPENDASRHRPVWHDWQNLQFDIHAELARRDIEQCASCHESSGADPVCLQCHRTTVSPHPDGFMQDVKGAWHDDRDAVCFVCHENGSRTPGVGFCGKCHGRLED